MTIIFIKKNKKDIKNKLKRPVSKLCKKQVKLKYKSHADKSLQTDFKKWLFLLFLVPILASFSQISMTLCVLFVHKVYKLCLFYEKLPFLPPKIKKARKPPKWPKSDHAKNRKKRPFKDTAVCKN